MMRESLSLLSDLQFEIVNFFSDLVDSIINCIETILHDRYLYRTYIAVSENSLTKAGLEIRKSYGRLVSVLDGLKAVRKVRSASES